MKRNSQLLLSSKSTWPCKSTKVQSTGQSWEWIYKIKIRKHFNKEVNKQESKKSKKNKKLMETNTKFGWDSLREKERKTPNCLHQLKISKTPNWSFKEGRDWIQNPLYPQIVKDFVCTFYEKKIPLNEGGAVVIFPLPLK